MKDSRLNIDETSPEVKSFICQQVQDFESFMTPKSIINVVSKKITYHKNKKKLLSSTHNENPIYKVIISITENSSILEEEAVSSNIFEAIAMAKTKLYNTLLRIQDEVISLEDREAQLLKAKNSTLH
jgi:ribosome-associated translation inhibitor RaiA